MKDSTIKWPADQVTRRKVADLIPYARNSRTHSDAQIEQLVAAIHEWGWTTPVLIDGKGGIISGHGRVMAAKRLGIIEVPCVVADGWTEAQQRAYVIADNKLTENGGWDTQTLAAEFSDLGAVGFDLGLTGFDDDAISALDIGEPEIAERTVALRPIMMTHVLISYPTSESPQFLEQAIKAVLVSGGRVDYGGN